MANILVVGSISTDLVVNADRKPEIGETIEGKEFQTFFGGKGANQAVACARLGAQTAMAGAVGEDEFGIRLLENLTYNQVSIDQVVRIKEHASGTALITVVEGDNSIIYVAGANRQFTPEKLFQTEEQLERLKASDIVLVQNETPVKTIEKLILTCQEYHVPVLYNPAPARLISEEWIEKVAFLTPNETEFKVLFPDKTMEEMLFKYPSKLIITLGEDGAVFCNGEKIISIPAFPVERIVDTTGAGDTFNGAFAVAYAEGKTIEESVRYANKAASLSIQRSEAQNGMSTLENLKAFFK
ncbi:ribokinase [Marinilactibacillus piezotolerans]|uniref:ribokinase n=1 Tax=Marinilactibacillus piezotolerans TaxID=258723 RepID=UPI0009B01BAB|nr:ribokinase [Marinilactibacillus piezotolerans]